MEPNNTQNTSKESTFENIMVMSRGTLLISIFTFVLGGVITYAAVSFIQNKNDVKEKLAFSYAMKNIPDCIPLAKKEEKDVVGFLISYDKLNSERLSLAKSKIKDKAIADIFQEEISREVKERSILQALYRSTYGQDYTPSKDNSYNTPDNYSGKKDDSEYLGILHGSLEFLNREYYVVALNSSNKAIQKVANDFMSSKVEIVSKIENIKNTP